MKQLFKIAFNNGILSIVPIAQWVIFSFVIDNRIINIFGITYPIQYVILILSSIFVTGANINASKQKKDSDIDAGFYWLAILGFVIFGTLALNANTYLSFMNMPDTIYYSFTIYATLHFYLSSIFSAILGKLYFKQQENMASKFTILYNMLDILITCVLLILIPHKPNTIIIVLLSVNTLVLIYMLSKVPIRFALKCNPIAFIKNESIDIIGYTISLISYTFGLRTAFGYGEQYALAASFCTTISDVQWDMANAIGTVTKIRICNHTFDYHQQIRHAYTLVGILIASIVILFVSMYGVYGVVLQIGLIYIILEIISMWLDINVKVKIYYLALSGYGIITSIKKILSNMFRLSISLCLVSPYCAVIGGLAQFIVINILIYKDFKNTYTTSLSRT